VRNHIAADFGYIPRPSPLGAEVHVNWDFEPCEGYVQYASMAAPGTDAAKLGIEVVSKDGRLKVWL
jgi:hypothetical protein